MKKVLIALDYNPTAQKVAEAGYTLSNAMNARSILLHVTSDTTYYSSPNYSPIMGFEGSVSMIETDTAEGLMKVAQNYLERTKRRLNDDSIQTIIETGDFGETILEVAAELKADIIVMGTHSRRGFQKILLGSVTEKVLRHSLIPLFLIPTGSR